MRRLLLATTFVAFALGLSGVSAPLSAQAPKKEAPKAKEKEKKYESTATAGTIELSEGKDGKYRYGFRDADGKYLGGSGPGGYDTKADAEKGLAKLRQVIAGGKLVEKKGEPAVEEKVEPKKK